MKRFTQCSGSPDGNSNRNTKKRETVYSRSWPVAQLHAVGAGPVCPHSFLSWNGPNSWEPV